MGGAGGALERAALLRDHLAQRRNGMRQEVGASASRTAVENGSAQRTFSPAVQDSRGP